MHPITLYWHDPEHDVRGRAQVTTSPCVLGRAVTSDVVLPFVFVSSQHARLVHEDGAWWVEDLESTNGVFVDDQHVGRGRLLPGRAFRLGRLSIRWEDEALAEATMMVQDLDQPTQSDDLRRLRVLLDLQREFDAGFSAEAALGAVLGAVLEISGADRACILLDENDQLHFAAGRHKEFGPVLGEDFRTSRTVVDRVLESGEALFQIEGVGDGDLASESIAELNLRAVATVPLHDPETGSRRGVLYADSTASMHRLGGLDREVFVRLAGEVEAVLARIDLRRVAEEQRRQEQELAFARRTQEQLLPRTLPSLGGWDFAAYCMPSREVGGDFYDLVKTGEDSALAVVADVSGKGAGAALLAASTQAALQMALRDRDKPGDALARVNDFVFARSDEGRFVTAFAGIVDKSGSLTWMSAGHNPAYLWRADSRAIEQLGLAGLALGALESSIFDGSYQVHHTRMAPGDVLLVYSDGVTEAEDPDGEQYGEERLLQLLRTRALDGSGVLMRSILEDVARFVRGEPASDDLTVLVIERMA